MVKYLGVLVIFIILSVSPASADRSHLTLVTDEISPAFSPHYRYLAEALNGPYENSRRITLREYNPGHKRYTALFSLKEKGLDICNVSDAGELSVVNLYTGKLITYSKDGISIATPSGLTCRDSYVPPYKAQPSQFKRARALLCSVPATDQFRFSRDRTKNRVYDIYAYLKRFPGGRALALVGTQPLTANNIIYARHNSDMDGAYVLINTASKKNYCVAGFLKNTLKKKECELEAPPSWTSNDTTPFLRQFWPSSLLMSSEKFQQCTFSLIAQNSTNLDSASIRYKVEWIPGEYDPIQDFLKSSTTLKKNTPSIRTIDLKVGYGQGCAYVIEASTDNPKLRMQTFTIGDTWCSHY